MNKLVTLTRDGKTTKILVRQLEHDKPVKVGGKFKYGSGKAYQVLAVENVEN